MANKMQVLEMIEIGRRETNYALFALLTILKRRFKLN
tara:strand:- start:15360 stop:15470 length:111 start_codon:yes stop_codon:yes gene_type:complete